MAPGGGGVFNEAGATVTVNNTRFTANQAEVNATSDVFGGGLLNAGKATVDSSAFVDNQALGGASFSAIGGSAGGGLDNFGGATLTLTNSTFTGNQALGAPGPTSAAAAASTTTRGWPARAPPAPRSAIAPSPATWPAAAPEARPTAAPSSTRGAARR